MSENRDFNGPQRIFSEKGRVETPETPRQAGNDGVTSIRRSEIVSVVPEETDLGKVFLGTRPDHTRERPDGNPLNDSNAKANDGAAFA